MFVFLPLLKPEGAAWTMSRPAASYRNCPLVVKF